MTEEIMILLMQDINREQIRFGTCEVKLTWHDGKLQFYELTTTKRRNTDTESSKQGNAYGR
jgi:hypothetical protein